MTDTLAAEINRQGIHTLEVPTSFETDGSFVVELRNRGESTHVHLHLDDALSSVAELEAGNHYVRGDTTRSVRVHVRDPDRWPTDGAVTGKLKVVTAYGAETRYVDVTLRPEAAREVEVDPELSKPKRGGTSGSGRHGTARRPAGGTALGGVLTPETLPIAALGAVAVILALGAVVAADGINVVLGVLAVLAAVLAAAYGVYR